MSYFPHGRNGPTSITILPTYRCTASCEQCCFGSNPHLKEQLTKAEIFDVIQQAKDNFHTVKQIVFSGGECLMLGDDLFDSVRFAHSLGLKTRIVSNGYWGHSKNKAKKIAMTLRDCGLSEINISTGRDHAQFVSIDAVLNALTATTNEGIFSLITVEKDASDSAVIEMIQNDSRFKALEELGSSTFRFQINSWMKFNEGHKDRGTTKNEIKKLNTPCQQLFSNLVVTPHKNISACCGLTFEHIPEMRIGSTDHTKLTDAFNSVANDFVKIWILMDGPDGVVRKVYDDAPPEKLISNDHMCDTCARMHKCETTRELIRKRYLEFYPEVMMRYEIKNFVEGTIRI